MDDAESAAHSPRGPGRRRPGAGAGFLATDDDSFDDGGALFESNDGGTTWIQRSVPASLGDALNGIFFFDSLHGWAWGNVNYRTTDGGTTWEEMPLLGSGYFMEFYSLDFGLTAGNFGAYVSRDGGLTWVPSPEEMAAFSFADDGDGVGCRLHGPLPDHDGGETFTLVQAGAAEAVAFLSSTVAVAIVDGNLVRSADGGVTWTGGTAAEGRTRVFAVSADVALAWGRSGTHPDDDDRILRSADGGETWTDLGEVIAADPFGTPFAFTVPAGEIVIASNGAGDLYRSADAGLTWAQTFASPGPIPGFLSSAVPVFADAQTGYFGFGAGFVLQTTDAGVTWHQISSGSGAEIRAMDRFANGDLIAVGESGQVDQRRRRRALVDPRHVGAGSLVAVQVVGPQAVVAVDGGGVVDSSADAGATWTAALSAPADLTAADLHFDTLLDGWVVGQGFNGAALFHTVDGGTTWTPVPDFQGTYVAVDFAGASGWAVAVYATLYRTGDGGAIWTESQLPGDAPAVQDLDFWNASIGDAVGSFGYAVRSSDGGLTWQILPTPDNTDQLTDIALIGADELWVSTAGGRVLDRIRVD